MANTWLNSDGLFLKFGSTKAVSNIGGEYHLDGSFHEIEFILDLAPLTETETILSDVTMIPKGSVIQQVEVMATTAAATGTAIDLGLIKADRTTEYDYDGLLAAFTTASMATGKFVSLSNGTSLAGAVLGVPLTEACYISASRTTATAFTAGKVRIRLHYFTVNA